MSGLPLLPPGTAPTMADSTLDMLQEQVRRAQARAEYLRHKLLAAQAGTRVMRQNMPVITRAAYLEGGGSMEAWEDTSARVNLAVLLVDSGDDDGTV